MNDAGTLATMNVLSRLLPSGNYTDPNLNGLLVTRMVNLSLEYGNCNESCVGYATLALATDFGDHATAQRFAQLSLDLVEKRGLDAFKARVYLRVGGAISPLMQGARFGRPLILQAWHETDKIGDVLYASHCRSYALKCSIASGDPGLGRSGTGRPWMAISTSRRRPALALSLPSFSTSSYLIQRGSAACRPIFELFDGNTEFDESDYERYLEAGPKSEMAESLDTNIGPGNYRRASSQKIIRRRLTRRSKGACPAARGRHWSTVPSTIFMLHWHWRGLSVPSMMFNSTSRRRVWTP